MSIALCALIADADSEAVSWFGCANTGHEKSKVRLMQSREAIILFIITEFPFHIMF